MTDHAADAQAAKRETWQPTPAWRRTHAARNAARRRERFAERRAEGLCVRCGRPASRTTSGRRIDVCRAHAQRDAKRQQIAYRRAQGQP